MKSKSAVTRKAAPQTRTGGMECPVINTKSKKVLTESTAALIDAGPCMGTRACHHCFALADWANAFSDFIADAERLKETVKF